LYANGDVTYSKGEGQPPEKLAEMANKVKTYSISNTDYRTIVSSAALLRKTAKNRLIFLTVTFACDPDEESANKILSNFLKNLKTNYGLLEYIWTKERQKNNKIHYHILCDIRFNNIVDLQKSFNRTVKNINPNFNVSSNSLRLPPGGRSVCNNNDAKNIIKYMAKYISKERFTTYKQPCFAISKGIRNIKTELSIDDMIEIKRNFKTFNWYCDENFGAFSIIEYDVNT
jgi:hypothetical protein